MSSLDYLAVPPSPLPAPSRALSDHSSCPATLALALLQMSLRERLLRTGELTELQKLRRDNLHNVVDVRSPDSTPALLRQLVTACGVTVRENEAAADDGRARSPNRRDSPRRRRTRSGTGVPTSPVPLMASPIPVAVAAKVTSSYARRCAVLEWFHHPRCRCWCSSQSLCR